MNLNSLIYLASPYTSKDLRLREKRARQVAKVAGKLILEGYNVFCPIAHSHFVAEHSEVEAACETEEGYENSEVHRMWMRVDLSLLDKCDELCVLMLEGYKESKGVQEELAVARLSGMPITYLTQDGVFASTEEPFYCSGG